MVYTSHGHHIPGTVLGDEPTPQSRARCGGPQRCEVCKKETLAYQESQLRGPDPITFDREDSPMVKAEKMVKSYVYVRLTTIFGKPEFGVNFDLFTQNGSDWAAIMTTTLNDNKLYEVSYISEEKKTTIREYRAIEEFDVPDSAIF